MYERRKHKKKGETKNKCRGKDKKTQENRNGGKGMYEEKAREYHNEKHREKYKKMDNIKC